MPFTRVIRNLVAVMTTTLVPLVGCSSSPTTATTQKFANISNKDFTEQRVLSAVFKVTLESQGFQVTDKATTGLTTSQVRLSLKNRDVDLYPEYTGTALTTFTELETTDATILGDPIKSWDYAHTQDLKINNIVWSKATTYNNTWAFALRSDFATPNNIATLSDLVSYATANPTKIQFLASNEFYARPNDGILAMLKTYGADTTLGACGTGTVPTTGAQCDVFVPDPTTNNGTVYPFFSGHAKDPVPGNPEYAVMVFGTDSQVAQYNLVVMQDDKKFWPNYACAATMGGAWATKYPDAVAAFNSIMPLLSNHEMQQLNAQVDVDKKTPTDVATAWLKKNGFLK